MVQLVGGGAAPHATSGMPTGLDLPLLTVAVQLGFAVGALLPSRRPARPDVLPGRRLFCVGAFVAAAVQPRVCVRRDRPRLGPAVPGPHRRRAGGGLPGRRCRSSPAGSASGAAWRSACSIGALTIGSALPHLFRAAGRAGRPRLAADRRVRLGRRGRRRPARARLRAAGSVRDLVAALQPDRRGVGVPGAARSGSRTSATSATCGSSTRCGPGCRCSSPRASRPPAPPIRPGPALAAFLVVGIGGVGCVVAGVLAPTAIGRTTLTIAAMARQRDVRAAHRLPVRRPAGPRAGRWPSSGASRSSPTRRSSPPRSPSSRRPGRPARRCRSRSRSGSC